MTHGVPALRRLRLPTVHRDQKIGLSLAVLIVGFTAAFCFRNEPLRDAQPLALDQTAALDARIEQLPIRAYTQREGVGGIPAESNLLDPASDVIDSSLVERPAVPMEIGTAPAGDMIELFAGPPEPLQSSDAGKKPLRSDARLAVERRSDEPPFSLLATAPSQVEPTEEAPNEPTGESPKVILPGTDTAVMRSYIVKSGDTLTGVSYQMYGTPRRYLDIYRANHDVLRDPNDLPVGTTLRIP